MDFSVSNLTELQRGHLEFILNSPSYSEIFVPYLQYQRDIQMKLLLRPDDARKTTFSDDYLRGSIHSIDNLLLFFEKLVEETNVQRVSNALQATPSARSYLGVSGPHGQSVRDYDPNQEF